MSPGRPDGPGRRRDRPRAGPGPGPPGPARPACSCRDACPSRQRPATPAHRHGPGSSSRQRDENAGERRGVHARIHHHPRATAEFDRHPARADRRRRRRGNRAIRHDPHRNQSAATQQTVPVELPPGKHLVGVHVVTARHDRNRGACLKALQNDPTLLRHRPATASPRPPLVTGAERPSSSNIAILPIIKSVDTRKVTTSDDERLENHRAPDKAALPGGVLFG